MGLRHVFTSTYDALNFHPQYWQLRTRDGESGDEDRAAALDGGGEARGDRGFRFLRGESGHVEGADVAHAP